MMALSPQILFLVLWLVPSVVSSGWIVPSPNTGRMDYANNNVYLIGSTIDLRWNVSLTGYSVWLWQQKLNVDAASHQAPIYVKDPSAAEDGGTTWTVTAQSNDLNVSDVFFLYLGVNVTLQGNGRGFVSHYLNLTTDPSLVTSSPSTSQSPSSSSSSASSSTSKSTNSSSSSNATKIGLGVGLGVGIPLLLIAGAVLFMMRRKKNRKPVSSSTVVEKPELSAEPAKRMAEKQELPAQSVYTTSTSAKHELAAQGAELIELPDNQRR